jgi:hypothetical protein
MTGPEWDWLFENAADIGLPASRYLRNLLDMVKPAVNDAANHTAAKNALFEMRQAVFEAARRAFTIVNTEFQRDPQGFVSDRWRPKPADLASNPVWDEPEQR